MKRQAQQSDNQRPTQGRLIVFSDDWGRHPSSCQHLTRHLLGRYPTLWVNTIGTRRPKLSSEDIGKIAVKLMRWTRGSTVEPSGTTGPTVLNPVMYPGFRRVWQRRLNAHLISRSVHRALGPRVSDQARVVITTVPIIADVVGRLDVDRWVYYCVDDFSVWPGLDGTVIDAMERQLVRGVDRLVAVSKNLQERLLSMGRQAGLMPHGIDLDHWGFDPDARKTHLAHQPAPAPGENRALPDWWSTLRRPILLFWGVVDRRLDSECCLALAQNCGTLVLLGPQQSPDPRLAANPRVHMPGPVPYDDLPLLAQAADVLVMPYADLPVTRAIQPLKLKEYLATGKPAVIRSLPATTQWSDAADVVESTQRFVQATTLRAQHGTPVSQHTARRRLRDESWAAKAAQLERILFDPLTPEDLSSPLGTTAAQAR